MRLFNLLPRLVLALVACLIVTGCVVVDYDASITGEFDLSAKMKKQYCIASAEVIVIDSPSEGKNELELLNKSLNNKPGNNFGESWNKIVVELKKTPGNYEINKTNLSAWKLNTRSIAPTLFELSGGTPVNIRAVIFTRPEKKNPWWVMTFVLTAFVLAPIESESLGAVNVAILDNDGKTLDSRTVIYRRSSWFSILFPWPLCAAGEFSAKMAGTSPEFNEENLQIRLMSKMAAEMLSSPPAKENPNWRNIRSATVESIANDNNDAALKLLKSATMQNLGGKECKDFLKILE